MRERERMGGGGGGGRDRQAERKIVRQRGEERYIRWRERGVHREKQGHTERRVVRKREDGGSNERDRERGHRVRG